MTHELTITHLTEEDTEVRDFVKAQIKRFNRDLNPELYFVGGIPVEESNVIVDLIARNANGEIVAGLIGNIYWHCLNINDLWVHEDLRTQGIGTQLMQRAEQTARREACSFIWVQTFSWQARGFYEKLGFRIVGQLDNYPPGQTRFTLRKDLKD